ncbi:MAG: hypothetical protein ACP6IU_05590 [Candidatus Asgardarchaeia archaeon]
MIHNILLIAENGSPILTVNFKEKPLDSGLLAGFFTAIQYFSSELGDELQSIILKGQKITYYKNIQPVFFLVIICDLSDPDDIIKRISRKIVEDFLKAHKEDLENWDTLVSKYAQFETTIRKIVDEYYVETAMTEEDLALIDVSKEILKLKHTIAVIVFERENVLTRTVKETIDDFELLAFAYSQYAKNTAIQAMLTLSQIATLAKIGKLRKVVLESTRFKFLIFPRPSYNLGILTSKDAPLMEYESIVKRVFRRVKSKMR